MKKYFSFIIIAILCTFIINFFNPTIKVNAETNDATIFKFRTLEFYRRTIPHFKIKFIKL